MQDYWWAIYVGLAIALTGAYHFLSQYRRSVVFFCGLLSWGGCDWANPSSSDSKWQGSRAQKNRSFVPVHGEIE